MDATPIEIERKYIIKKPKAEVLTRAEGYTSSEIEQIYLNSHPRVTHRIRKRKTGNITTYTETKKIRIDKVSAYEDEREISEEEYKSLSALTRADTRPVRKVRHTFVYENQLFEIDEYPKWKSICIMETELKARDEKVEFPSFIKIIKEVTGEREYSNAKMAESFPEETKI